MLWGFSRGGSILVTFSLKCYIRQPVWAKPSSFIYTLHCCFNVGFGLETLRNFVGFFLPTITVVSL